MGGCLPASTLRHRRMLLEVRGAEDGSLARRRFEAASQRRLRLLVQVEAQLDVVLDAPAGVYLLVDLLVARGVHAALKRERAVHRVIVNLIHRTMAAAGATSGLLWSDLQIFGFARGEHTSSTADPLLLTLRLQTRPMYSPHMPGEPQNTRFPPRADLTLEPLRRGRRAVCKLKEHRSFVF